MKMPHGLLYAILIIVGILAVTLYTRQQTSTIAGAAINAQTREPAADDASAMARSDEGSKAEDAKTAEDAPK